MALTPHNILQTNSMELLLIQAICFYAWFLYAERVMKFLVVKSAIQFAHTFIHSLTHFVNIYSIPLIWKFDFATRSAMKNETIFCFVESN